MTQSTDRAEQQASIVARPAAARAPQMAVPARVAATRGRTILTSVNSPSCVSMNAAFQPNSAARPAQFSPPVKKVMRWPLERWWSLPT